MNGTSIGDDVARAAVLGIRLTLTAAADRETDPVPAFGEPGPAERVRPRVYTPSDHVGPRVYTPNVARVSAGPTWNGCPTCDDGIVTIETARAGRCRECLKGGL